MLNHPVDALSFDDFVQIAYEKNYLCAMPLVVFTFLALIWCVKSSFSDTSSELAVKLGEGAHLTKWMSTEVVTWPCSPCGCRFLPADESGFSANKYDRVLGKYVG
ncbi:hypothetical protein D3C73_1243510 [compost metagenome]